MQKQNGVEAAWRQRLRPSPGPTQDAECRQMVLEFDSIMAPTRSVSVEASSNTMMRISGGNIARVRARQCSKDTGRLRVTMMMVTSCGFIRLSAVMIARPNVVQSIVGSALKFPSLRQPWYAGVKPLAP